MTRSAPATSFLSGGGEVGRLIAGFDWSSTPLGPILDWPGTVKSTVALMLRSPVPMVALWGAEGTMIYNDAYSVFAGTRHPALLGAPVREGWPEVADFNDNVMRVGLAGETLSYPNQELTLYRSGGPEQVFMNLDYSPIIDEAGRPIGVLAIVVDTTALVQATRKLQENERRLQFLDAVGRETAKSTDADTILAVTTRMVGEHLGVTSCAYADMDDDQDGFTIRGDWAAPGAMHIVGHYSLADFGRLAVTNLSAGLPLVINDNLSEIAPEEAATFQRIGIGATICMPLVKEGRLTALMAIHHRTAHRWSAYELSVISEVTERSWAHIERVRSEAEAREADRRFREDLEREVAARTADLNQSENNLRTVFETSFMSQGLLTIDGRIIYVNGRALSIIGAALEDVVGRPFWETEWFARTPGMPEKIRDAAIRAGRGESVQMSLVLQLADDAQVVHEFSMRPAYDQAGRVVALVPEAIDITARVRAEAALHQSQKVEAIGNLTGGIAHDFNNLLMAVLGSLELLRKRVPPEDRFLRLVDNALEGARRGKGLTERMLAFARKQDLQPERISLNMLVTGMAELMQRSLGPTIALGVDIPSDLPAVEIDPNQLESALLNLVLNGRDAMRGTGPLRISAREGAPPASNLPAGRRYVCLSVADAGDGMDEATLKRATEPFFSTKGVGKGTGLGLSMVQGLAEQSGGTLVLKSASGAGTTAEIWLPAAGPGEVAASPAAPPPAMTATQAAPLRVLVVDDDSLVLAHTADMLEDLGHAVIAVPSAQAALDQLRQSRFDVLLSDHAMPHMTGAQLIEQIRGLYPQMPAVLASGFAELPEDARFLRLRKPYSQADLIEVLGRVRSA